MKLTDKKKINHTKFKRDKTSLLISISGNQMILSWGKRYG